jgi:hypothetical protein
MSTDVGTISLRPARFDDYEKIRQLGLTHSLEFPAAEDWRRLCLSNPLLRRFRRNCPIGWVLETEAGKIVGNFGTVRTLYTFRGDDVIAAAGSAWCVTAPYRGFALMLMDEYFNQPGVDIYINNAVSIPAVGSFDALSQRVPLGEWDSMSYWITGYVGDYPAEAAPTSNAFTIDATDRFDFQFDAFWKELVRQNPEKLLAERSSEALSWHFGIPMRKGRLWILTASRHQQLRAYCILTRRDQAFRLPPLPHGDTEGPSGMRLVDYQTIEPDVDLLPGLLQTALQRCAKEDVSILEHLGRGVPKMRALDDCVPYRKKLTNWKFFYRAADPGLDDELREAKFWDPSAYDGEASFE